MGMQYVLVTGGAGYIGSHVYLSLKENNFIPIIIDNFCNSYKSVISNLKKITKSEVIFHEVDVRNKSKIKKIINKYAVTNIIHLAAYKSVQQSIKYPSLYFDNNVNGLISILNSLDNKKKYNFVFSSSACVYSSEKVAPYNENTLVKASNPYGHTKIIGENILSNVKLSNINVAILRYFNPAGAHESALIGQNEKNENTNLLSFVDEIAIKKREQLAIYGNNHDTPDGTCIRDYFHVMDLARAHSDSLLSLIKEGKNFTINLGSGLPLSVLEVINHYSKINKVKIPIKFSSKRFYEPPAVYSLIGKAKKNIGWEPIYTIQEICKSSLRWKKKLNKIKN